MPHKNFLSRMAVKSSHRCWYCGEHVPRKQRSREHLLARSLGGGDEEGNVVMAHQKCNSRGANLPVSEKIAIRMRLGGHVRFSWEEGESQ